METPAHVKKQPPSDTPGWVRTGWPDRTGLGVAVRHGPTSVELRSDELVVAALRPDPEQIDPPGEVRVYLSAVVNWPEDDEAQGISERLPAAVVLDTGFDQVRLDLAGAAALAAALQTLVATERPDLPPD